MHSSFLFALCLMALTNAVSSSSKSPNVSNIELYSSKGLEEEWKTFKLKNEKNYTDADEEERRMKVFAGRLETIDAQDRRYTEGHTTYTMGINPYSDMSASEIVKLMTGYKARNDSEESSKSSAPEANGVNANEVNWIDRGFVTPVKDQKQCGSCWAFSTTGTLEGQLFRTTTKLVSLSEQQLVDCVKENGGCNGGWPYKALTYVSTNNGIDTEESYPYEAKEGPCRYNPDKKGATCRGFVKVPATESDLEKAVAEMGPISVSIDASLSSFQQYKNGIYDDDKCSQKSNHAVLVVGYGQNPAGKKYWIVKNSWGTQWGNEGYIFMAKDKDNQCGIATDAVYPLI